MFFSNNKRWQVKNRCKITDHVLSRRVNEFDSWTNPSQYSGLVNWRLIEKIRFKRLIHQSDIVLLEWQGCNSRLSVNNNFNCLSSKLSCLMKAWNIEYESRVSYGLHYITLHSSAKESKSFWTVWNHDRLLLYLSELPFKSYKWLLLEETVSKAYSYTSVNFFASFFVFIAITSASAEILRLWRLAWQLLWRCIRKRREQVTLRWKCLPKLLMKYALWLRKETPKRWRKTR